MSAQGALELFHGRASPDQHLDDWGSQGPVFLVDYVHVTYLWEIKLGIPEPAGSGDLHYVDDLLFYDGVYYGDWSVFPASLLDTSDDLRGRLTTYDPRKAALPPHTDECTCCRHFGGTLECNGVDCQRCVECAKEES